MWSIADRALLLRLIADRALLLRLNRLPTGFLWHLHTHSLTHSLTDSLTDSLTYGVTRARLVGISTRTSLGVERRSSLSSR